MKDMVDINVIIDERYEDPLVNIYTKKETEQEEGREQLTFRRQT